MMGENFWHLTLQKKKIGDNFKIILLDNCGFFTTFQSINGPLKKGMTKKKSQHQSIETTCTTSQLLLLHCIQLKLGNFLDGYQRTRLCSIFVCMSLQSGSKT